MFKYWELIIEPPIILNMRSCQGSKRLSILTSTYLWTEEPRHSLVGGRIFWCYLGQKYPMIYPTGWDCCWINQIFWDFWILFCLSYDWIDDFWSVSKFPGFSFQKNLKDEMMIQLMVWCDCTFSNLSPFTENCGGGFECLSFLCPAPGLSVGFLSSSSPPLLWLLWLLPSPPHSSRFLNHYS